MNPMKLLSKFSTEGGFNEALPIVEERLYSTLRTLYQKQIEKDVVKTVFIKIEPNTTYEAPTVRTGYLAKDDVLYVNPEKQDLISIILNLENDPADLVQRSLLKMVKGTKGIKNDLYPKINTALNADEYFIGFLAETNLKMYICHYDNGSFFGKKVKEITIKDLIAIKS